MLAEIKRKERKGAKTQRKRHMFEEKPIALSPVNFFQFQLDCHRLEKELPSLRNLGKYRLPNLSAYCGDTAFAEIAIGWQSDRIELFIEVDQPFKSVSYPLIQRGDSVEIFLDTRDVKTTGFCTRFCHHFFFLPEAFEGKEAGEITRFRTEDLHELCDPETLKNVTIKKGKHYSMHIVIPAHSLHGYDPEQFDRLGFAYRINRTAGSPQHFSVSSDDYSIEQQPSLWSSLKLV